MAGRHRHAAALALLLLTGACAELRTPPDGGLLPPELVSGTGDPVLGAAVEAAAAFRDGGAALAGRPAETARELALLEFLAAEIPTAPRFAGLAPRIGRQLVLARDEARAAMGLAATVPAAPAISAYAAAARALRANDQAAAATALAAPRFAPGGMAAVERLGALGTVPTAELATAQAAQALVNLDGVGRVIGRDTGFLGPVGPLGTPELATGF